MVDEFAKLGVPVASLDARNLFSQAVLLARHISRYAISVVLCGSFRAYMLAKLATLSNGCRVVFWIPSMESVVRGSGRRWLFRVFARRDSLVFVSHAVRRAHEFSGHLGRSAVVYHGVEDPYSRVNSYPYEQTQRSIVGLKEADVVVGYIAEFAVLKEHRVLLEAARELASRHPDIQLVLVGGGEEERRIRSHAEALGIARRVHILGLRSDARRLLGLFDVYTHPGRNEGFGLAVVEAMLAGLPVVAADTGAPSEYVRPGESGLLFKTGDERDLAKKIATLLADAGLRARLGRNARQQTLGAFSPTHFADELTSVIEAVVRVPG